MKDTAMVPLPRDVGQFVDAAMQNRWSGSVILHFVAGGIRSWELRVAGRIGSEPLTSAETLSNIVAEA